jgi:adenylate kinase family enzyme
MNKIITKTVIYRGTEIPVSELKEKSQIKVIVECKHGQRHIRWCRRNRLCKKCSAEAGVFNTAQKGRKITWGDKISEAKKGKLFSDDHKQALLIARIKKICDRKGIPESAFDGFPTSGEQLKLRNFAMSAIRKKLIKYTVEQQDALILEELGYSVSQLKKHIESNFEPGMTWDNYGEWHIDHVVPDSWFTYDSANAEEFQKSWSLSNLSPMWAWQNIDKSNKYEGAHRPRKFYILAGQFGVGKTTMCESLKDRFTVISYDKINVKKLDSIIANNYFNEKPLLIDIPTNISTIINRYSDKYEIHTVLIVETPDIVQERIRTRGGVPNLTAINRRHKRMQYLSKNYANFTGTYDEIEDYLHNLKI